MQLLQKKQHKISVLRVPSRPQCPLPSSVHHLVHRGLLVPGARHDVLIVGGDVTAQHGRGLLRLEERKRDERRRETQRERC